MTNTNKAKIRYLRK